MNVAVSRKKVTIKYEVNKNECNIITNEVNKYERSTPNNTIDV
jgi:hypothetical protein